jgi:alpha-1,6-mannosyltransferase
MIAALVVAGPTIAARLRNLAGNVLAAALGVGLSVLLSGTGFGWIHNFGTPGRLRTGIAPADVLAQIVRGGGWLVGVHLGSGSVLTVARAAALSVGVGLSVWLLCPRRAADGGVRPPTLDRLGLALLAMALLGPVLYGWYLAPALPLLAIAASRRRAAHGARLPQPMAANSTAGSRLIPARAAQWTVIALSTLLTFATVPSLAPAWRALGNHPHAGGAAGASVVAVIATLLIAGRRRAVRHPERLPTASAR